MKRMSASNVYLVPSLPWAVPWISAAPPPWPRPHTNLHFDKASCGSFLWFLQVVCDLRPLCRLLRAKGGQTPARALKSRQRRVRVPRTGAWDQKDPLHLGHRGCRKLAEVRRVPVRVNKKGARLRERRACRNRHYSSRPCGRVERTSGARGRRRNSAGSLPPPAATGCSRATARTWAGLATSATSGTLTTPTRSSSAVAVSSRRGGVCSLSARWRTSGKGRGRLCCVAPAPDKTREMSPPSVTNRSRSPALSAAPDRWSARRTAPMPLRRRQGWVAPCDSDLAHGL
jgi:hypothetical protein